MRLARVVTSGVPPLPGATMLEYQAEPRCLLLWEPCDRHTEGERL